MPRNKTTGGFTLLEVLITLFLLAFGLTAVVSLQMKLHMTEVESYQRSQAIIMLQEMASLIRATGYIDAAGDPVTNLPPTYNHPLITDESGDVGTNDPLGKGDADYDPGTQTCTAAFANTVDRTKCEWSNLLKGASEKIGTDNVGGSLDARGCIEQIQNPNNTAGICQPAIFRITVVWQGMHETVAPVLACGQDLYGDGSGGVGAAGETYRRAISTQVMLGLPRCT